jgi:hypothetical protein
LVPRNMLPRRVFGVFTSAMQAGQLALQAGIASQCCKPALPVFFAPLA